MYAAGGQRPLLSICFTMAALRVTLAAMASKEVCEDDAASLLQGKSSIIASTQHVRTTRTALDTAGSSSLGSWTHAFISLSFNEDSRVALVPGLKHPDASPVLFDADRYAVMGMCGVMAFCLFLTWFKAEKVAVVNIVCLWVTSSVAMNIVNKIAVRVLPLPMTLLIVQMVIAIILLLSLCGPVRLMKEICEHAEFSARWSALTFFFSGGLITSILALQSGSVSFFMIVRNLMPLFTLLIERPLLPVESTRPITQEIVLALTTLAAGTAFYAGSDLHVHSLGWIVLNMIIMITYRLAERRMLWDMPRSLSFGALNLLQNTFGMIPVVALFFAWGEHRALKEHPDLFTLARWHDPMAAVCILFSGCAGLSLGYYSTMLQKEITATTMVTLQCSMKVIIIFLAMLVLGERFRSWSALGCFVSLVGGGWYARITTRPAPTDATIKQ